MDRTEALDETLKTALTQPVAMAIVDGSREMVVQRGAGVAAAFAWRSIKATAITLQQAEAGKLDWISVEQTMAGNTTTPTRLRIDFVSDVVCPWCAVGLMSLEQALERTRGEVGAEIHFQPFELNPQLAAEGEDAVEHLRKKYGMPDAQLAANQETIRQRGAELGFTFDMARRSRIHNTFDAHRLLHWAEGEGKQRELKHALLRAYFTEGRDVSDHDTLVDIAGGAGLPMERARGADFRCLCRRGAHRRAVLPVARCPCGAGGHP